MELTPEGFLLCRDVAIARCGTQLYRNSEIPHLEADDGGWISVDREPSEVFNPRSIASFIGKPIVNDHPMDMVTPDNYEHLTIGQVYNVRRGTNHDHDLLIADLLFTTKRGINLVRSGKRAVSVGYDAFYEQTGRGLGRQRNIVANHLALVDEGRCGSRCTILDGAAHYNLDADFNEAAHPRVSAGQTGGGQFTSGSGPRTGGGFTSGSGGSAVKPTGKTEHFSAKMPVSGKLHGVEFKPWAAHQSAES